ncbi:MAG: glutamate--tRNA ligase [Endomicrobium sp.]|jgi:glutamyl-tRNA synthetase|nr:glutamate--tRNA ligase [Endomicrobium sp.]
MKSIIVRFAPSPTGDLHVGGIRTALFNWLFAKNKKGKFILRIEDTDELRSSKTFIKSIIDALLWLELKWDNNKIFFQMQHKDMYIKFANLLIDKDLAYPCYCSKKEIEILKKESIASKTPFKYNKKCSNLSLLQRKQLETSGKKSVLRLRVPNTGSTSFEDSIRGKIIFENSSFDDFIILKPNGIPTYNFACVIDDHIMKISHVLRGDDHISNTPKQIFIYKAFNWEIPKFAHMSMILGKDGARLSKRHSHISVLNYRKEGFLAETILNYLALLGWSTEDSQQIFTIDELKRKFSLNKCSSSPAIFDPVKLLWLNSEKIRLKTPEQLCRLFIDWLNYNGNLKLIKDWDYELLTKAIELEHSKIKVLKDILYLVDFFFVTDSELNYSLSEYKIEYSETINILNFVLVKLVVLNNFSAIVIEQCLRNLSKLSGKKSSNIFHVVRFAISGKIKGPSLFHMMEIMGKHKVIARIKFFLKKASKYERKK